MTVSYKKPSKPADYKRYSVGSGSGSHFAFADTLAEAKKAGEIVAKKELWRGKWNLLYLSVNIHKNSAVGDIFYKSTGWRMYVPVRGSGKSARYILDTIKSREKTAPMKWVKRK